MADLYPMGYGTDLVTVSQMRARHMNSMEPEFARRLFNWLESKGGSIGIGGGHRTVQPTKPGFAPPGMSFHQSQRFRDNTVWYCAVDLVHRNEGKVHRATRVSECPQQGSPEAAKWGVHINTSESWHMQPIEVDGFQSWINGGRKRPVPGYSIPGAEQPDTPVDPPPVVVTPPTHQGALSVVIVNGFPVINPGDTGPAALNWQRLVNLSGAALTEDGQFGPASQNVCNFVRVANGLPSGTTVDDAVWLHSVPKVQG